MNLIYLEDALADLSEIGEYIAEDDPEQARQFLSRLRKFSETIGDNPRRFQLRSEWGTGVRAANFGNYLIIFEDDDTAISVLRIANGRRNIAALLIGGGQ